MKGSSPVPAAGPEPPAWDGAGPSLADVLSSIGAAIVEVVDAPRGLDHRVLGPIVHDPVFPPLIEPGDVVLAVGVVAGSGASVELIRAAGARGAAAVVLKVGDDARPTLKDAAAEAGVAVLGISPEMGWGQCLALFRTALASAGTAPESGAAPGVGDLFGLANAVAAMVGGAVTIEDTHSRVLAYSSIDEPIDEPRRQTILGRRVPEPWLRRLREAGVFRKLWATEEVVGFEYPGEGLRPRIAIAVRAGGEILGSIWVSEGREPFGPGAETALREAGRLAALHLIKHRTSEDVERQMRADLLRSVLEGRWPPELAGARLGVAADTAYAVVAFEPAGDEEDALAVQRERALDLIAVYSQAFRRRASCAALGTVIYALLPMNEPSRTDRLSAFAAEVVAQAERAGGIRLRAGIGSVVSALRDVPASRRDADQALRVARADGETQRIADIEEVRGHAMLLELQDIADERRHLREGKLMRLVEHDGKHDTDYVETLRAFLETFGDVPRAAERVRVHRNTFRYRLQRLQELSGIDLADPRERLAAEIQLQFIQPRGGSR